ncbi:MAG: AraC family transcriptional regulator [Acidobacteria bacterium]|nr:AraC family transcriptional regulator [Acidobacteriota bacterium]
MGRRDAAATASEASVAMHFVRLLTDYCEQRGLPPAQLFKGAGLGLAELDEPDARLPFADFDHACRHAAERLGDPNLGLHLALALKPEYLGPLSFALVSCDTLLQTMRRATRFVALVFTCADAPRIEWEQVGEEVVTYFRSNQPTRAYRLLDELNVATQIALARWATGRQDLHANWVSFRHSRPADEREYVEFFRCPIRFDAKEAAIGCDARLFELRLPQANREVRRMMDALCERQLKGLGDAQDPHWLAECKRAIVRSFADGEPMLASIAPQAKLTPRALRNRLTQRGGNFSELVEALRRDLALSHMEDPSLSIVAIAFLLGYSDQSAFQRAFKRWTGRTPGDYRRERLVPAGGSVGTGRKDGNISKHASVEALAGSRPWSS